MGRHQTVRLTRRGGGRGERSGGVNMASPVTNGLRKKGLTSVELADLAGVSSATVSRAFSPGSRIKPETRRRVLALAEQYGFRPNAMARSLNNSQSRLVALIVNTVGNPAEGEGLTELVHRLQELERLPLLL